MFPTFRQTSDSIPTGRKPSAAGVPTFRQLFEVFSRARTRLHTRESF